MASHTNPAGYTDYFRSDDRQVASDQLLAALMDVADGGVPSARITVSVPVDPPSADRAKELAYSAAWFHDSRGRWVPGPDANPYRLVHRLRLNVVTASRSGFELEITRRA